uniref:AMP-binding protein n=1 Tax=Phenylobacterium aquaticum TaxID=1763816 RepID=UPI0034CE7030
MTPADDQAAVRVAAPPFKPLAQKPPSVTVEHRADGSILVSSKHAPAEGPRSIAQLLADRAAAHPDRPYLHQREPGHGPWRGVTYGQAKQAADSIAQWLIDQGLTARDSVMVLSGNGLD